MLIRGNVLSLTRLSPVYFIFLIHLHVNNIISPAVSYFKDEHGLKVRLI